ncbi:hypothetical protein [Cyanobium sp. WAJ14-Wanaka]|uniref:hypothetical protein n=1 Tax=Cyanobium sp. WAJ14-Wanaka TaxID=2823725 RepID=UPI0020CEE497|nr:hypothetical protein [Cyanobium sp. WAJ14-Wanaka]MCP9774298.1 hypothetical protein [Cyanobium sp. WAJ14-Wanaka]
MVPNTNYQLLFGSVQATGTSTITFVVNSDGNNYSLNADCQSGLLNGQAPSSAQEAQVLNSACQVAFGNA